jgi:hypothetical protein
VPLPAAYTPFPLPLYDARSEFEPARVRDAPDVHRARTALMEDRAQHVSAEDAQSVEPAASAKEAANGDVPAASMAASMRQRQDVGEEALSIDDAMAAARDEADGGDRRLGYIQEPTSHGLHVYDRVVCVRSLDDLFEQLRAGRGAGIRPDAATAGTDGSATPHPSPLYRLPYTDRIRSATSERFTAALSDLLHTMDSRTPAEIGRITHEMRALFPAGRVVRTAKFGFAHRGLEFSIFDSLLAHRMLAFYKTLERYALGQLVPKLADYLSVADTLVRLSASRNTDAAAAEAAPASSSSPSNDRTVAEDALWAEFDETVALLTDILDVYAHFQVLDGARMFDNHAQRTNGILFRNPEAQRTLLPEHLVHTTLFDELHQLLSAAERIVVRDAAASGGAPEDKMSRQGYSADQVAVDAEAADAAAGTTAQRLLTAIPTRTLAQWLCSIAGAYRNQTAHGAPHPGMVELLSSELLSRRLFADGARAGRLTDAELLQWLAASVPGPASMARASGEQNNNNNNSNYNALSLLLAGAGLCDLRPHGVGIVVAAGQILAEALSRPSIVGDGVAAGRLLMTTDAYTALAFLRPDTVPTPIAVIRAFERDFDSVRRASVFLRSDGRRYQVPRHEWLAAAREFASCAFATRAEGIRWVEGAAIGLTDALLLRCRSLLMDAAVAVPDGPEGAALAIEPSVSPNAVGSSEPAVVLAEEANSPDGLANETSSLMAALGLVSNGAATVGVTPRGRSALTTLLGTPAGATMPWGAAPWLSGLPAGTASATADAAAAATVVRSLTGVDEGKLHSRAAADATSSTSAAIGRIRQRRGCHVLHETGFADAGPGTGAELALRLAEAARANLINVIVPASVLLELSRGRSAVHGDVEESTARRFGGNINAAGRTHQTYRRATEIVFDAVQRGLFILVPFEEELLLRTGRYSDSDTIAVDVAKLLFDVAPLSLVRIEAAKDSAVAKPNHGGNIGLFQSGLNVGAEGWTRTAAVASGAEPGAMTATGGVHTMSSQGVSGPHLRLLKWQTNRATLGRVRDPRGGRFHVGQSWYRGSHQRSNGMGGARNMRPSAVPLSVIEAYELERFGRQPDYGDLDDEAVVDGRVEVEGDGYNLDAPVAVSSQSDAVPPESNTASVLAVPPTAPLSASIDATVEAQQRRRAAAAVRRAERRQVLQRGSGLADGTARSLEGHARGLPGHDLRYLGIHTPDHKMQ